MTTFDEREKSYERKFQHDQELAFKIKARRNKLLGLWAAERLGLQREAAEAYARDIVASGVHKHDDERIIAKIAQDFASNGVAIDSVRVRAELARRATEARNQLGTRP